MHINDFPVEILDKILTTAAACNEHDGVCFTYGLSEPPKAPASRDPKKQKAQIQRYVRGMVPPVRVLDDIECSLLTIC